MNSNVFRLRSLKTRVTLFTLAIFVIGIWSLAFYTSRLLYADMQRVLGEQQFSTVSMVAAEISAGLDDRTRALEQAAAQITPAMLRNAASMQKFLDNRTTLPLLFNGGFFVLAHDGTAIADFPLSTGRRGLNFMDRKYASGALKAGKTTIGSPVMGKALRSTLFSIAAPIHNAQGKVIGAFCGTVDLAKPNFLSRIADNSYGRTGGYLVVAPKIRTIVFATDKKRILEVLPPAGNNPLIDRFIHGDEGTAVTVNPLGEEVLASAKGIPASGWYVVATLPTREAFVPISAMQQRMVITTIFLTLLAGGLTWWMLKRQLTPMFTAMKALAALSETNQAPQPLPITSQDEIGELIGGFNRLLGTLEQRDKALRESVERQRTILQTAMDGFWLVDKQGRLLEVNETYCRMSGYSKQELLNMHITDLEAAEAENDTAAHIHKIISQGEDRFDSLHRRKDGSVYNVEVSVQYQYAEGGVFVVFVQDITGRKKAEEEKDRIQAQLLQAQKMESIGNLAGGIAHDFNNILTAIIGYGNLALMKMATDDPQRLNIENIIEAGGRAAHLTKDLLLFSRKQISQRRPVDLNDIIRNVEKFLKRVIGEDIDCKTSFFAEALPILGDYHQLEQVLMNLATNARDVMQKGGIFSITTTQVTFDEERISAHGYGKPGKYALIIVSDTGEGMDAATRQHIFEPFFTTKEPGKGTGLGLSVVFGIIKQHEGFVDVYSEPGQGTTFKVYLPLTSSGVEQVDAREEPPPSRGTETILLAEDDAGVRNLTSTVLEGYGYTVIRASDGQAAVDTYRENKDHIQLLLFDIIMPKKSGKEAYDEIRAIRPDIKILFQSGYAPDLVRQKMLLDDEMPVIFKPVPPMMLLKQVRCVLDRVT